MAVGPIDGILIMLNPANAVGGDRLSSVSSVSTVRDKHGVPHYLTASPRVQDPTDSAGSYDSYVPCVLYDLWLRPVAHWLRRRPAAMCIYSKHPTKQIPRTRSNLAESSRFS